MIRPQLNAIVEKYDDQSKSWSVVGTITKDCEIANELFEYIGKDGRKHVGNSSILSPFYLTSKEMSQ